MYKFAFYRREYWSPRTRHCEVHERRLGKSKSLVLSLKRLPWRWLIALYVINLSASLDFWVFAYLAVQAFALAIWCEDSAAVLVLFCVGTPKNMNCLTNYGQFNHLISFLVGLQMQENPLNLIEKGSHWTLNAELHITLPQNLLKVDIYVVN